MHRSVSSPSRGDGLSGTSCDLGKSVRDAISDTNDDTDHFIRILVEWGSSVAKDGIRDVYRQ